MNPEITVFLRIIIKSESTPKPVFPFAAVTTTKKIYTVTGIHKLITRFLESFNKPLIIFNTPLFEKTGQGWLFKT
jgi:hypothetical protein